MMTMTTTTTTTSLSASRRHFVCRVLDRRRRRCVTRVAARWCGVVRWV